MQLAINLERRPTAVGRSGWHLVRKSPHHVCANFLPYVGQVKSWRVGRHALSAEAALGIVFATVAPTVVSEAEAAGLALPPYVTPPQAVSIATAAAVNKLPIAGTAVAALAVVADRAESVLHGHMPVENDTERAGIVPIRPDRRRAVLGRRRRYGRACPVGVGRLGRSRRSQAHAFRRLAETLRPRLAR